MDIPALDLPGIDTSVMEIFSYAIDLVAVLLLALGIKGLSKVRSARSANSLAALAMALAVAGLLIQLQPAPITWLWIGIGTAAGGLAGLITAQRVPMTAMPETVALFNGCGGMASLLVALGVALFQSDSTDLVGRISIVVSVFVGAITFSGSIVAMAKCRVGWIPRAGPRDRFATWSISAWPCSAWDRRFFCQAIPPAFPFGCWWWPPACWGWA